jgi:glycosyltransferase involved in cell wall biosynthesis
MKIGIVIATYQRNDGSTPHLLSRALESIKNQTHQDYIVFLIGDKYEDNNEFIQLATSIIPLEKIYYHNLPTAVERDKYIHMLDKLWCSGGVNAMNYGISLAIKSGYDYICHLDHDDYWHPQHLEMINHTIETTQDAAFVYTCGTYFDTYLPRVELSNQIIKQLPVPAQTIHSAVCINHKQIPLLYRDVFAEEGHCEPADADMWSRISSYITQNRLSSYLVTALTAFHPTEHQ